MIGESFDGVLAAAKTGAEWAWTVLYRDLAPTVAGYMRAQGAVEPEDVTCEAFLTLVKSLSQFNGDESSFRSWVFVIAHRKLLDARRYQTRRPTEPAAAEILEAHASSGDVEQEALRNLGSERVGRLLMHLTSEQRDVLLLRILGGLQAEEIALAVGKRPGAVRALQKRGLARIKALISEQSVSI